MATMTSYALVLCCLLRSVGGAAAQCSLHNSCASCLGDKACGWCTGDIGGGNPGSCLPRSGSSCDTVFETDKCPDCHLPWIRFANTVPSENTLDCTIAQGSVTHSWNDYGFAQFSDWSQTFKVGKATITISSAGKSLVSVDLPLTPGPLVVVVKDSWPPNASSAVETIAASYNPVKKGEAGVRLFNLAPDPADFGIGLRAAGKTFANGVKYSLGSSWYDVGTADTANTYTVFGDTGGTLGSLKYSPPRGASTIWVLGLRTGTPALKLVPEIDAPQVCGGAPDSASKWNCNSTSATCVRVGSTGIYNSSQRCQAECTRPPPPPPPTVTYSCGFNSTCVVTNANSTGPRYNTSDCNNNCTIYTPKCECSGTAAKPGHCIAAKYNVSIHPCGDPAFGADKQEWIYDSATQHMKLKNSGVPGDCMIACGISWADHPDIKVAQCDVNDPRQQFGQVHHENPFGGSSPAGCGPGQTHQCWHWETIAFIGNCIDGEGCGLDNGNVQSYPCDYEGGCDHIYSNQMWELDTQGYLRDAQKCINGSTTCELFYCATATPLVP